MKPVLGLLAIYLFVHLGFIALGVGIGFLLRWLLPSVDLGTGILVGVVSTGLSVHFFLRMLALSEYLDVMEDEDGDSSSLIRVYPVGQTRSTRKRKRK